MWMKRVLAAFAAAAFAVQPAFANWEWTHWGMTPDEVIAASDGKVTAGEPKPEQSIQGFEHRATGSWSQYGFDFVSDFYFDPGTGLRIVALSMAEPAKCADLRAALAKEFGTPQETSDVHDLWTNREDEVRV